MKKLTNALNSLVAKALNKGGDPTGDIEHIRRVTTRPIFKEHPATRSTSHKLSTSKILKKLKNKSILHDESKSIYNRAPQTLLKRLGGGH